MWNPNISFRPTCNTSYNVPWFHKRKLDADVADLPPPKMHITEEKMVSQLKGIHLSKEYTSHGNPGPSNIEVDMDDSMSLSNILSDRSSSSLPTLVVCDEIREFQKKVDSPLPKHILDNFKRPTNALVLWRPPAGELNEYLMNIRDSPPKDEQNKTPAQTSMTDVDMYDEDDNNNGSDNRDLNGIFSRTV